MKIIKSNYTKEYINQRIEDANNQFNFKEYCLQKTKKFIFSLSLFIGCMCINYYLFKFIHHIFSNEINDFIKPNTIFLFYFCEFFIFLESYTIIKKIIIKIFNLKKFYYKKSYNDLLDEKIREYKRIISYIEFQNNLLEFSMYDGILTDEKNIKLLNYVDKESGLYKEKIIKVPEELKIKIYKNLSIDFSFIDNSVNDIISLSL